jgi:transposase-like protein
MDRNEDKYTPEYKYEVIMEVLKCERTMKVIAQEKGIPYEYVKRWKRQFLKDAVTIFNEPAMVENAYIRTLRRLREENNLTCEQVAQYINGPPATYTDYESGNKELPIDQLKMLAQFYKVSSDYILGIK